MKGFRKRHQRNTVKQATVYQYFSFLQMYTKRKAKEQYLTKFIFSLLALFNSPMATDSGVGYLFFFSDII